MQASEVRGMFTTNVGKSVISAEEFRRHAEAAETFQLLMCAIHVSGDASLLGQYGERIAAPFNPLFPQAARAEEPGVRDEIIQILIDVLSQDEQAPYLGVDDRELFQRMSDIALGYEVKRDQIDMNLQQSGFVPDVRTIPASTVPPRSLNVAIIGAGMTGIDAAVKAADRGIDFEVFDLEGGPGGLWWSQTYPGVAVDTPATFYSLSWEVTPDWSRYYPNGAEYQAYLQHIVEKYDLASHIHYNSNVTKMQWLELEQVWELTVFNTIEHSSRTVRAAAVITGAGHLCRPKFPNLAGIDTFAGESMHSAKWNSEVELEGKRVAVVGTGAAGVQVIASIAPVVGHLTVFQRQAPWVAPNRIGSGLISESERWLRHHLPYYLQWARLVTFVQANTFTEKMNHYDADWMVTHELSASPVVEGFVQADLAYIDEVFGAGSEMGKKVTPDYPFGGKRGVRDPGGVAPGGYFWAYTQPHVDLINDALVRVVPEGIVTADGVLTEVDVIIWATGMTLDYLSTIEVIGRDGVVLAEEWADDNPRTYIGGSVPGFPNLFVNDGPNTGVANGGGGHNFMSETVNHFAFACLELLIVEGATSIEPTAEAHEKHNEWIEAEMLKMIWSHDRKSNTYYRNKAGRIVLPSPFPPNTYWQFSQKPDPERFVIHSAAKVEAVA